MGKRHVTALEKKGSLFDLDSPRNFHDVPVNTVASTLFMVGEVTTPLTPFLSLKYIIYILSSHGIRWSKIDYHLRDYHNLRPRVMSFSAVYCIFAHGIRSVGSSHRSLSILFSSCFFKQIIIRVGN